MMSTLRALLLSIGNPGRPKPGEAVIYVGRDRALHLLDDRGTDTTLGAAGGSSPLTTKGDLYTYSTVDARLPVGTSGQVLTADSTASTGLRWASLAMAVRLYASDGLADSESVLLPNDNPLVTTGAVTAAP